MRPSFSSAVLQATPNPALLCPFLICKMRVTELPSEIPGGKTAFKVGTCPESVIISWKLYVNDVSFGFRQNSLMPERRSLCSSKSKC